MRYDVLGLILSDDESQVLLLKKIRPEWQLGQLNGIGGGMREHESPMAAMLRKGQEELDERPDWWHFATLNNHDQYWMVYCFVARDSNVVYHNTKSHNDVGEEFEVHPINHITGVRVKHLDWLLEMARAKNHQHWPLRITERAQE